MKPTTAEAIFRTIPKTYTHLHPDGTSTQKTIWVEGARHARVHDLVEQADVVITFRYMEDRESLNSPTNRLLAQKVSPAGDIVRTRGEMTAVTMSLNIYARTGGEPPGEDLVDQVADALILWTRRDLPRAVTVLERGPVHDLTSLEQGLDRRQMDVIVEVPTAYQETVRTIDHEEITYSVR